MKRSYVLLFFISNFFIFLFFLFFSSEWEFRKKSDWSDTHFTSVLLPLVVRNTLKRSLNFEKKRKKKENERKTKGKKMTHTHIHCPSPPPYHSTNTNTQGQKVWHFYVLVRSKNTTHGWLRYVQHIWSHHVTCVTCVSVTCNVWVSCEWRLGKMWMLFCVHLCVCAYGHGCG